MTIKANNSYQYYEGYIKWAIDHAKRKFENFIAALHVIDEIQILEWRNINGSFEYAIRIIFDIKKGRMFVSGDLGEAIFNFTENATLKAISKYSDLDYFRKKMACSTDDFTYNTNYARLQLEEEMCRWDFELHDIDIDKAEFINDIVNDAYVCGDQIIYSRDILDAIQEYDEDYPEWLPQIGKIPHLRTILWWQALKLAQQYITDHPEAVIDFTTKE